MTFALLSVRGASSTLMSLLLLAGCTKTLPPAATPDQVAPPPVEDIGDPPGGHGKVLIDVTNGEASVDEVILRAGAYGSGGYAYSTASRTICRRTPCWAHLELGDRELVIRDNTDEVKRDIVNVRVSQDPKVLRHALGRHEGPGPLGVVLGTLGVTLGATAVLTGGIFYLIAPDGNSLESIGQTLLISGAIGLGVGIIALIVDGPVEQAGASTEYTYPGPADDAQDDGAFVARSYERGAL